MLIHLIFPLQDDLPSHRLSKRLNFPETINFDMQSNGALDLVSTSQRVVRNSNEKEIRENVFSSSKLCSLYDKVLEVLLLRSLLLLISTHIISIAHVLSAATQCHI